MIRSLLATPWLSNVLALGAIILAYIFYVRGKSTPRLVYQERSVRLIGGDDPALPEDVTVTFAGVEVPRLSKSVVVLWNAGNTTIRGSEIVERQPLRIAVGAIDEGARVLEARVTQVRRKVNAISAALDPADAQLVRLTFDYLDSGDGARIEVLHTSRFPVALVIGSIRGVPKGCLDWGQLPPSYSRRPWRSTRSPFRIIARLLSRYPRLAAAFVLVVGVTFVVVGLLPDVFIALVPSLGEAGTPMLTRGHPNWVPVVFGLLYTTPMLSLLWSMRRRYPRELEELEDGREERPPSPDGKEPA